MKTVLEWMLPVLLFLAGCATAPGPDTVTTSPPARDLPPTGMGPLPTRSLSEGSALQRGIIYINSTDLLIRESFPPQVSIVIRGNLPTPCHKLRVVVNQPDADNKIAVDAYTAVDPNKACIQVLKPFEETIDLDTYPAGKYSVWVNGKQVGEFDT